MTRSTCFKALGFSFSFSVRISFRQQSKAVVICFETWIFVVIFQYIGTTGHLFPKEPRFVYVENLQKEITTIFSYSLRLFYKCRRELNISVCYFFLCNRVSKIMYFNEGLKPPQTCWKIFFWLVHTVK